MSMYIATFSEIKQVPLNCLKIDKNSLIFLFRLLYLFDIYKYIGIRISLQLYTRIFIYENLPLIRAAPSSEIKRTVERNLLLQVVKSFDVFSFRWIISPWSSLISGRIGSEEGGIAGSGILRLVLGRDDDLESRVSGRCFPWPVDLVIALQRLLVRHSRVFIEPPFSTYLSLSPPPVLRRFFFIADRERLAELSMIFFSRRRAKRIPCVPLIFAAFTHLL